MALFYVVFGPASQQSYSAFCLQNVSNWKRISQRIVGISESAESKLKAKYSKAGNGWYKVFQTFYCSQASSDF